MGELVLARFSLGASSSVGVPLAFLFSETSVVEVVGLGVAPLGIALGVRGDTARERDNERGGAEQT